jgi:hypothetical protein
VVASVVVELDLPDELYLDAVVLQPTCLPVQRHVHLPRHRLPVVVKVEAFLPPVLVLDVGHLSRAGKVSHRQSFSTHLSRFGIVEDDVDLSAAAKVDPEEALEVMASGDDERASNATLTMLPPRPRRPGAQEEN